MFVLCVCVSISALQMWRAVWRFLTVKTEPPHVPTTLILCSEIPDDTPLMPVTGFARWIQFNSVAQLCLTLCYPMDCNMPGFPVHHPLPKLAQTHVLCVSDAIQPSCPLSPPSPFAFNLSQHLGLHQ